MASYRTQIEATTSTDSPELEESPSVEVTMPDEGSKDERPEGGASQDSMGSQSKEVFYHKGATELFIAIEDMNWEHAVELAEQFPEMAETWVISSGTANTTFNWSLWRRLPLHEACRRQPPAWFISALLAIYPAAADKVTQFGELPLHLAVECGAAPEVVNVLLTANWHGICTKDQSDRTPLEILNESEMLAMEDHKVAFESLSRARDTYDDIERAHHHQMTMLKMKHAKGIEAIRHQHNDDLAVEAEQQDQLMAEVDRLTKLLAASKKREQQQQQEIARRVQVEEDLKNEIAAKVKEYDIVCSEKCAEKAKVESLEGVVKEKQKEIKRLEARIVDLNSDLQMISAWQDKEVRKSINRTQMNIRRMVDSFMDLQGQLNDHGDGLRALLDSRGIESVSYDEVEEKKLDDASLTESLLESDGEDDPDDVMQSAAAASTAALLNMQ